MAVDYLARNRLTAKPCRFDVVAIDGSALTYYKAAFVAE
jgi:Holliday junction resolvase-like predicted endonuclease